MTVFEGFQKRRTRPDRLHKKMGATMSKVDAKGVPLNGLDLSGKHALVTGGGTGLGRQMADALAEAGARVTICGRRAAPLKAAAEAAVAAGRDIGWTVTDVTNPSDRRKLFEDVKDVDILVNNAALGERKPWLTVTVDEWRAIMNLNLEAPFALSQLFVPPMIEKKWGRVINISSVFGLIVGDPALYGDWGVDLPSYIASKHGLIGLTKHLAMMLGSTGVTVNALCPGMFPNTEQNASNAASLVPGVEARTPVKRAGNDTDLRAAIVYLASPGSKFYTGQSMVVDGGWTIW
jgi:NAD(P)-dependent dehydrogenase (short-subunit alcohol dehydrogenase family)